MSHHFISFHSSSIELKMKEKIKVPLRLKQLHSDLQEVTKDDIIYQVKNYLRSYIFSFRLKNIFDTETIHIRYTREKKAK